MSREGSNPSPSVKDLKEDKIMKKIILDESILDIDTWLPQEAIDQIVELIRNLEKHPENTMRNAHELSLNELLNELEKRGIDTSKLNLIEE